jgi:hypothetical protein
MSFLLKQQRFDIAFLGGASEVPHFASGLWSYFISMKSHVLVTFMETAMAAQ